MPILKWPGGKRWLVQRYQHLFPRQLKRYFEPFLGSGAVYFYMEPQHAVLGDVNQDVIALHRGIRQSHNRFVALMQEHQKSHSKDYYYRVRAEIPDDEIERAARVLYLNRVCFNGIYRVNKRGEFNVPIGTKTRVVLPTDDFPAASRLLQGAEIVHAGFATTIRHAGDGDLVFADPPYTVRHNNNGFIKYNETLFSWSDQIALAEELIGAKERGARILCTNANHASVRELYEGRGFKLSIISRYSSISASAAKRGHYEELLITG